MTRRHVDVDEEDEGSGAAGVAAGAGVAALLSILGNVLQAKEGAERKRRIAVLQQEQGRLVGMVQDWQAECSRVAADYAALRIAHDSLIKKHDGLCAEIQRIRVERDNATQELMEARERIAELTEKPAGPAARSTGTRAKEKE